MRFHHTGYVVASVRQSLAPWEALGLRLEGPPVVDPIQRALIAFLSAPEAGGRIELVEPTDARSPVAGFLERHGGGGLHHVCFEVDQLEGTLKEARKRGALPVMGPVPATALAGRRIAFLLTRGKALVELLEAAAAPTRSGE